MLLPLLLPPAIMMIISLPTNHDPSRRRAPPSTQHMSAASPDPFTTVRAWQFAQKMPKIVFFKIFLAVVLIL
jgi:hypothetical protein